MTDVQKNVKGETFRQMFQFQTEIFNNALDNLSEEAALRRVSDNSNHMNWLLGHILHCRFMLTNMIGLSEAHPFGQIYWTSIENKMYPTIKEVSARMPEITERLLDKLASVNDDEIDLKADPDKPSLSEIISFFVYHEAYHLGQIGIVRKIIGLGALKSS